VPRGPLALGTVAGIVTSSQQFLLSPLQIRTLSRQDRDITSSLLRPGFSTGQRGRKVLDLARDLSNVMIERGPAFARRVRIPAEDFPAWSALQHGRD